MPGILAKATVRQEVTSGRTSSLPRRTGSQARCETAERVESITVEPDPACVRVDGPAVRAVMDRRGIPVKVFAINAKASRTQVSEALQGVVGRHLALGWVLAQEEHYPGFVDDVFAEISLRMGMTASAQRHESFGRMKADIEQAIRPYWFRPRSEERGA